MEQKNIQYNSLKDVSNEAWKSLSNKKIIFGHNSVGYNIIGGLKKIIEDNPKITLKMVENNIKNNLTEPGFYSFWVGKNEDPESKIIAFSKVIDEQEEGKLDIAMFKFCFVDIVDGTNVNLIFNKYKKEMLRLKKKYPKTTFIHATVPITCIPKGFNGFIRKSKNFIKRMLGKPIFDLRNNINRYQFNELLRKEFMGKEPIFDIAKYQSTTEKGERLIVNREGRKYYSLNHEYTYDGGHLNEKGSKILAEKLVMVLLSI